jgi:hypothetical protein
LNSSISISGQARLRISCGPRALGADLGENGAHAVVDAEGLATHQLVARQQAFGVVAEIDDDVVAGHLLDRAGDEFADAVLVQLDHLRALRVAHLLHDDLLGGLRGDAAELDVLDLLLVDIAGLERRIFLRGLFRRELRAEQRQLVVGHHQPASHGLVVAGLAIDRDLDIRVLVVALLRRHGQGRLDRLENDVLRHPLLADTASATSRISFVIVSKPHQQRAARPPVRFAASTAPDQRRQTATGTRDHPRAPRCPRLPRRAGRPRNARRPSKGRRRRTSTGSPA